MWLDDFRARVEAHPERTAIRVRGERIGYRDLWDRSAAAGLRRCSDRSGLRHLVAEADGLACLEGVIGAWIQGRVPVVLPPALPDGVRDHVQGCIAHPVPDQAHE